MWWNPVFETFQHVADSIVENVPVCDGKSTFLAQEEAVMILLAEGCVLKVFGAGDPL
jgi:hypothetical protein